MNLTTALLFLELLTIAINNISFCNGSSYTGCIESERKALLRIKQDLTDSSNRLASWTGEGNCCKWVGIVCDNITGHVLELKLQSPINPIDFEYASQPEIEAYYNSKLGGQVSPSLLELKQLVHLDLSLNFFGGIQVPKFLGSLRNLIYLNLSDAGFGDRIPHQIGNLTNLQFLDLSNNTSLYAEDLSWLSCLSSLKHLDFTHADLSRASEWLSVMNPLPSLEVLRLSYCQILHLPSLQIANLSSLRVLDLSQNYCDNLLVPRWVFELSHLVHLDLSYNSFGGAIPNGLQNLTSLRSLNLAFNAFNYSIPDWLYKFKYLELLSLQWNKFQGLIPHALGNLTSVKVIFLSYNYELEGRIPRSFGSLCNLSAIALIDVNMSQEISEILDVFSGCVSEKLESLDLTNSQLSGNFTNQLGKFRNLKTLNLRNNSISGPIPSVLGKLSSLVNLDLSHNKLNGFIPLSLGNMSSMEHLDLSSNKLNGSLFPIHFVNLTKLSFFYASQNTLTMEVYPDWKPPFQLRVLGLRSCHIGLQFPSWVLLQKKLSHLDISNSGISDVIPNQFWKSISGYNYLNLSHNQIYGKIPNLIEANQLESLDLSSNNFSGPVPQLSFEVFGLDVSNNALSGSLFHFLSCGTNESKEFRVLNFENNSLSGDLPDCWANWSYLWVLNLNNNNFSGNLPTSLGSLPSIESLHVRKNHFSGMIPVSLKNCKTLVALDIGENEFSGRVPAWIGEELPKMLFLNLRSNKFQGPLPIELCHLASLQILDLAYNNLVGSIPRCINNFSDMVIMNNSADKLIEYRINYGNFLEDALLVMKGKMVEYNTILNLVRIVDLSSNNFSGEIPAEVTDLRALQSLNLSHNSFTGKIPKNIGAMKSLESIDLSHNQLSGEIPHSITSLSFLSRLNFSNNKLIGKIPVGTQLQSLDASCFSGNELCGSPLPDCFNATRTPQSQRGGRKASKEHEVDWFYVSMGPGFVVGFWIIIGPLAVNRRWRYRYCHFLDRLGEKFYCVLGICN
ncbi:receptor-like protein EIX2 [Mangifera indica]|uniref:receptor-like protein EIX2 n=1 Tax=Mangifera indica TaxID=29780 RepID=UPI001CFA473A|nr:receptor-like protein EIX2 [Mangifera indica]